MRSKTKSLSIVTVFAALFLLCMSTCAMADGTTILSESFDAVSSDIDFTAGTTDTFTADAGEWLYDCKDLATTIGIKNQKLEVSESRGTVGDLGYCNIFHTLSSPISAGGITSVTLTARIVRFADANQNFTVSIQSGKDELGGEIGMQMQLNPKSNKPPVLFAVNTVAGRNPITDGTNGSTQADHEYLLTATFTLLNDGTTNCDYAVTDLTDPVSGTLNLSGSAVIPAELADIDELDTINIFANAQASGTVDDIVVRFQDNSAVQDWLMY